MEAVDRELVTFLLIAYNQQAYIREAVEAAFAQTYEPLQIVISDDHSSDATFEIIREMAKDYVGPHTLLINRNPENLGLCGNVNHAMSLSAGSIIVIAGGDDVSQPDRTMESWQLLSDNPDVGCVSLGLRVIDAAGDLIGLHPSQAGRTVTFHTLKDFLSAGGFQHPGASRAFRRSVFDFYGPLAADAQTEDSTTLLRCLLHGRVCLQSTIGVNYRVHGMNYSMFTQGSRIDRRLIHRQYMQDANRALEGGLIDHATFCVLEHVLLRKLTRIEISKGWEEASLKMAFVLARVVSIDAFSTLEKLRWLLRAAKADITSMIVDPRESH